MSLKDTPVEQLQDFESIERSVRDHMLEQVSPQRAKFFYAAPREPMRVESGSRHKPPIRSRP